MKNPVYKPYAVYLEDKDGVIKCIVPAVNERDAKEILKGNGEPVAVKDVSESFRFVSDEIFEALCKGGIEPEKANYIAHALRRVGVCK